MARIWWGKHHIQYRTARQPLCEYKRGNDMCNTGHVTCLFGGASWTIPGAATMHAKMIHHRTPAAISVFGTYRNLFFNDSFKLICRYSSRLTAPAERHAMKSTPSASMLLSPVVMREHMPNFACDAFMTCHSTYPRPVGNGECFLVHP